MPIYTPYGRGRNMTADDLHNLMNPPTLSNCTYKFIIKDDLVSSETYQKAIPKLKEVYKNVDEDLDTTGLQGAILEATSQDSSDYLADQGDDKKPAMTYEWFVSIKAPTRELAYKQKQVILDRWHGVDGVITKSFNPIQWFEMDDSLGIHGRTHANLLSSTFDEDLGNFSTVENYGAMSYYPKTTLQDEYGTEFGIDILSDGQYQEDGTSRRPRIVIDCFRRLQNQAIIAQRREMSPKKYKFKDRDQEQSQASCMAQGIANQFLYHDKRVIHIVLNDFDYFNLVTKFGKETESLQNVIQPYSEIIDVTKISINPLEPFETDEGIEKNNHPLVFESVKSKIVALSNLATAFNIDSSTKGRLNEAFDEVMSMNGIKVIGTDEMWERRNYLNRGSDYYPVLNNYISRLNTKEGVLRSENKVKTAEHLEEVVIGLKNLLGNRRRILGNVTEFSLDLEKKQHYFNFENLGQNSEMLVNAQFVNILDYCENFLQSGDLLIIHGAENIDPRLYDEYLTKKYDVFRRKGIKLLFGLDVTDVLPEETSSGLKKATVYDLKNRLYKTFTSDNDFFLQGIVDDISQFEELVQSEVNALVRGTIESKNVVGRFLFFSDKTRDNVLISGGAYI